MMSIDVSCPYCAAFLKTYVYETPWQVIVCFGCDQPFIIEWAVRVVDKIRKVEGYEMKGDG